MATLRLYDEATRMLYFHSAYPPHLLSELKASLGDLRLSRAGAPKIGIAGRAALEGSPQLVNDVSFDPDYFEFLSSTRSALAVPLIGGGNVLGVLNVESDRPAAFDALHVHELAALAEMAVIAIRNAAQYEELERTRSTAEARTALALMGMASSTWGHRIRGNATNIRELVLTLRRRLSRADALSPEMLKELDDKLARLEFQATQILEKPLADPLLSAKGLGRFSVRRTLEMSIERMLRMKADVSFSVVTDLDTLGDDVTVHCNPEWLGRAFDILLDNAVRAMSNIERERHLIEVSAVVHSAPSDGEVVKITVTDTGPGIPPELRHKVLRAKIDEAGNSGGSGVGLLMARTIFEAL